MDPFTVSHFSDRALLHDLKALVAQDRKTTAVLLTRIAEVEERKLYRQAGYDSMFACCLHELHFSEDAAYRHITAARVARRFPGVLVALAEGRLHMRAVLMLARHLTSGNADELVSAATHKTRAEIELLLAQRFPRPDLPQRLQAVPSPAVLALVATPPAPEPAGELAPERVEAMIPNLSVTQLKSQLAPERVEAEAPRKAGPAVSNCRKPVPSMLMTNKRRAPEACFENTTARPPGCQAGCASASTSRCGPMPLVSASHTSGRFAPSEVCAQWDQTIMPPTGDHRGY